MNAERPRTRVFISYAQADAAFGARVLALANALRRDGIIAELDQYHQQEPLHWPRWCAEQLLPAHSDWVLMVCTPAYRARLEAPETVGPTVGRGVYWEGTAIINAVYDDKGNHRFVPVLLDDAPETAVPGVVDGYTRFRLRGLGLGSGDRGYEGLYRLLTRQPGVVPPAPGAPVDLPPWAGSDPLPAAPGPIPDTIPDTTPDVPRAPGTGPRPAGPERPPVWALVLLVTVLLLAAGAFWWWGHRPDPALRAGDAAMDQGRFKDALVAYGEVPDRDDPQARYGRIKAAILADPPPDFDQEAAERQVQTLRGAHPGDPHLPLLLGILAHNRGDGAAAETRYREALQIDPGLAHAWFGLGVLAESRGDRGQARADYERALVGAPGQRQYLTNLAGVLLAQGDSAGALRQYEALLQGAPGLLLARLDAGNAARLAGDLAAACWHHDHLLAGLDEGRDGAFAGPDNGGEWLFDTPGGEVSLQTAETKAAYIRAAVALTRALAGAPPCAAPAGGPIALGGDGRVRALIEADLDRLGQARPDWRERLAAVRGQLGRERD